MKKNLLHKRPQSVSHLTYLRLAALTEGQSVLVNALQVEIEKATGRYPSRAGLVATANRQLKKLRLEGRFVRHIFGHNKEILGWEYGRETDEQRAKNTGEIIIYTQPTIGRLRELANISSAALNERSLNASGVAIARLFASPETGKMLEDTKKKIEKNKWLRLT